MAARAFTSNEWDRIEAEFDRDPGRYGLPERVYGSAVLASFNIRKLGAERKRSSRIWSFLGRICSHFDLLAVQEVMDDLSGLKRLRAEMGPEYGMIVSDKTGAFPGDRGLNERLAFLYRRSLVQRAHVVSDITYDRSKIHEILSEDPATLQEALQIYRDKLRLHEQGRLKRRPKLDLPFFLSFIRQPYCVSFRILGHPGTRPYEFLAVNAHLIYGRLQDRKREFDALMEWIIRREMQSETSEFPGLVLLGDLNLDFDDPQTDIGDIGKYLRSFPNRAGEEIRVAFPFLETHPGRRSVFRTNARLKQTYDHIGLFYRARRIPESVRSRRAGSDPRGPDYRVVNFVELFSKAVERVAFRSLPKSRHKDFYARFEHSVSDHMPIWFRIPLPDD